MYQKVLKDWKNISKEVKCPQSFPEKLLYVKNNSECRHMAAIK